MFAHEMRWQSEAACRGSDVTPFFPARDGSTIPPAIAAMCVTCPVRLPCLTHAFAFHEPGYWGASSERQRRRTPRLCVECGDELDPGERAATLVRGRSWGCCTTCEPETRPLTPAIASGAQIAAQRAKARWQPTETARPVATIAGYDSDWLSWLDGRMQT